MQDWKNRSRFANNLGLLSQNDSYESSCLIFRFRNVSPAQLDAQTNNLMFVSKSLEDQVEPMALFLFYPEFIAFSVGYAVLTCFCRHLRIHKKVLLYSFNNKFLVPFNFWLNEFSFLHQLNIINFISFS